MSRNVIGLLIVLFAASCKTEKPISHLQESSLSSHLFPVFILPHCDHKNGIEAVAIRNIYDVQKNMISITVIFRDEDQPFFLFDWVYDAYRKHHYKRKRDVETLLFTVDTAQTQVSCSFPTTWSGRQRFHKGFVEHYTQTLPLDSFASMEGHTVIYINTWNHLFSNVDTNPALPKDTISYYPYIEAGRDSVERILRYHQEKKQ